MKEKVKIIIVFSVLLFIFLGIFFLGKKFSLNNYLNKTDKYSNEINYSTGIDLNIKSMDETSRLEYSIRRANNIKEITINKYNNEELTSNISKYLVTENGKSSCYMGNSENNSISCTAKEDFKIDYKSIKDKIIKIVSSDTITIDDVNYKKYIVSMKKSDAYNLIYDDNIIEEKDLKGNINVEILIDKSNKFVYKIKYTINNLNNNKNNKIKYKVEIINYDINNNDEIVLPF